MVRTKFPPTFLLSPSSSISSASTYLFWHSSFQLQITTYLYAQFIQYWTTEMTEIIKQSILSDLYFNTNKSIEECSHRFVGRRNRCMASFILRSVGVLFSFIFGYHLCQGGFAHSQSTDWWFQIDALSIFWILECIFLAHITENKFTGDILCDTYVVCSMLYLILVLDLVFFLPPYVNCDWLQKCRFSKMKKDISSSEKLSVSITNASICNANKAFEIHPKLMTLNTDNENEKAKDKYE